MRPIQTYLLFSLLMLIIPIFSSAKDYTAKPQVRSFIRHLSKRYHIDKAYLFKLFSHIKEPKRTTPSPLPAKPYIKPPKHGSWDRYSRYKLSEVRIKNGVEFIQKYESTLKKVEEQYGVSRYYIAAIIGIETAFGKNRGKFHVFDRLSWLAFGKHSRRNRFYRQELEKFLHLAKRERFNPKNVLGSSSGAIGLCQFMPSNYEHYGIDFNHDGHVTLQRVSDAAASVANYFRKHRWQSGKPVASHVTYKGNRFYGLKTGYTHWYNRRDLKGIHPKTPWPYKQKVCLVKLDRMKYDELWYGAKNFYVITRYNHSDYYAMAVHQLAQALKRALKVP